MYNIYLTAIMECQTTTDICDKYVAEYNGFHYVSVIIFLYNTDVIEKKKRRKTYLLWNSNWSVYTLFCTIRNEIVIVN